MKEKHPFSRCRAHTGGERSRGIIRQRHFFTPAVEFPKDADGDDLPHIWEIARKLAP
jgi:hypothetical protein